MNWFRAQKEISGAFVEGYNNRAKLTTRKAYGFRTFEAAQVALYHTLAALPEPDTPLSFATTPSALKTLTFLSQAGSLGGHSWTITSWTSSQSTFSLYRRQRFESCLC